jgi:hypothetical protein
LRERIKGKMLIASDEGDVVNGVVIKLYGEETNGAISIIEQPFEPGLLLPPHVDENDVWLHVLEMRRAGLSLRAIADVMKAAGFVLSHVGVKKVLEAAEDRQKQEAAGCPQTLPDVASLSAPDCSSKTGVRSSRDKSSA